VAGFIDGVPIIIETDQNAGVHIRDSNAAIGEGFYLAEAALLHRNQSLNDTEWETIYHVYEAKNYAERVGSVSAEHWMGVMEWEPEKKAWRFKVISKSSDAFLEELLAKYGPKKLEEFELPTDFFVEDSSQEQSS
jgi:hypothetical protein